MCVFPPDTQHSPEGVLFPTPQGTKLGGRASTFPVFCLFPAIFSHLWFTLPYRSCCTPRIPPLCGYSHFPSKKQLPQIIKWEPGALSCLNQTSWVRVRSPHSFIPFNTFVSGLDLSKVRHTVDVCLIIQQQVKQNKPPWLPGRDTGIMGSFRLGKTSKITKSHLLTLT